MIVYHLMCEQQHRFEGWFDSGNDFSDQHAKGAIECPVCASKLVRKVPAASYVKKANNEPLPANAEAQYDAFRRKVMDYIYDHTEDVGPQFTEMARQMYYEEIEHRGIRGKATPQQVSELSEEGIEVFAIPPEFRLPDKLH